MAPVSARRITVRPLRVADVPQAVRIHLEAFPSFFLSELGPSFLRQLYTGFCHESEGIAFAALDGAELLGVVAGTGQPAGFFKRLLVSRWLAFGLAALPAVLRKPARLLRVLRAVSYRGDAPETAPGALLSTIAVSPAAQGRGVGTLLVRAFCEEAVRRDAPRVYLTTDRDANEAVNVFYQRLGFVLDHWYTTPEGRRMNRYVWAGA